MFVVQPRFRLIDLYFNLYYYYYYKVAYNIVLSCLFYLFVIILFMNSNHHNIIPMDISVIIQHHGQIVYLSYDHDFDKSTLYVNLSVFNTFLYNILVL